jgi:hypothetical protein
MWEKEVLSAGMGNVWPSVFTYFILCSVGMYPQRNYIGTRGPISSFAPIRQTTRPKKPSLSFEKLAINPSENRLIYMN